MYIIIKEVWITEHLPLSLSPGCQLIMHSCKCCFSCCFSPLNPFLHLLIQTAMWWNRQLWGRPVVFKCCYCCVDPGNDLCAQNISYLYIVHSFSNHAEQLLLYQVSFCLITANGEYPGGHWGNDRTCLFSQRKNCLLSACSHSLNTGHGRGHFSNAPPPSSYHQGNYPPPRGGGHQPFQRKTHARTNTLQFCLLILIRRRRIGCTLTPQGGSQVAWGHIQKPLNASTLRAAFRII